MAGADTPRPLAVIVAAYQSAYKAIDEKSDYRNLVDAKLTALGAAPAASAASGASQ